MQCILDHRCYTIVQVWEHWTAGTVLEMVDPCMNKSFSESDALRCIHVGLLCIQGNPADRPMMSTVAMMLGSDTFSLPAPSKPAFYSTNLGANSSTGSSMSIDPAIPLSLDFGVHIVCRTSRHGTPGNHGIPFILFFEKKKTMEFLSGIWCRRRAETCAVKVLKAGGYESSVSQIFS